jgi:hypothetical protein
VIDKEQVRNRVAEAARLRALLLGSVRSFGMLRHRHLAIAFRVLGGLTAGYGAYNVVRPHSLARSTGLDTHDQPTTRTSTTLGRAIGMRDVLSGTSMLLAPAGAPRRLALAVRVTCDLGDAIGFGLAVPRSHRAKVIGVCAGWGLLCASTFRATSIPTPTAPTPTAPTFGAAGRGGTADDGRVA